MKCEGGVINHSLNPKTFIEIIRSKDAIVYFLNHLFVYFLRNFLLMRRFFSLSLSLSYTVYNSAILSYLSSLYCPRRDEDTVNDGRNLGGAWDDVVYCTFVAV